MSTLSMSAPNSLLPFGNGASHGKSGLAALGQYILNMFNVAEQARLAALPRRLLEDVGMVPADIDAGLPGDFAFYPDDIERARPFV